MKQNKPNIKIKPIKTYFKKENQPNNIEKLIISANNPQLLLTQIPTY